jgi:hypothetical protein
MTADGFLSEKNAVFLDATLRRSCEIRRFRGTYRLQHQDDKIDDLGKLEDILMMEEIRSS